jgi:hypothetical protein
MDRKRLLKDWWALRGHKQTLGAVRGVTPSWRAARSDELGAIIAMIDGAESLAFLGPNKLSAIPFAC